MQVHGDQDQGQRRAPWRCPWNFVGAAALLLVSSIGTVGQESTRQSLPAAAPNVAIDTDVIRERFQALGIEYGFIYTGEALANLSGGLRKGGIFDGKLEATLQVDLGKLAGWNGLKFYANAFQLHGTGRLKADYVGGLNTVSNIEALPATRLSELWLEQQFVGGALSVRVGQLAADTEFLFSDYGNFFVNSDWPTIAAANLPSGGPAYPLSTPGVRIKIEPSSDIAVLVALFNGDPAGPGPGDDQKRNRHGLNFRIGDPPLGIAEIQISANQEKSKSAVASRIKLGGWVHAGRFADQRLDERGVSLAAPTSNGTPLRHSGNYGIYGVVDQQLYRPAGGDANSGITAFGRIAASPSDRNLVSFYFEGGIIFTGLIPTRPDDRFGASLIYAQISDG